MPEILTKHPEIVLQVLKSQGAQCGTGAAPKILTRCPPEKFCKLSGGELCVFGPEELSKMTQLVPAEVCRDRASGALIPGGPNDAIFPSALLLLVGCCVAWRSRRMRHPRTRDA